MNRLLKGNKMNREKFEEIMREVNDAKVHSLSDVDYKCKSWSEAKPVCIAEWLDIEENDSYQIKTKVYKIGDWFVGIRGIHNVVDNDLYGGDFKIQTIAFEMEQVPSITYIKKKC